MGSDSTDIQPPRGPPFQRRIKIVGYDGSANGRNVVEGAMRRVRPGDRLVIVHVLDPAFEGGDPFSRYAEVCRQMFGELDPAVLEGIDYELRVVTGSPAQALIDAALQARAIAIVIGTRRGPWRLGQRTIRSELEAGPVPVVALVGRSERESHPLAKPVDGIHRYGYDSFPASDPPSSWGGRDALAH
jgi:nucleotide-binding universal stress UspA family protein